MRVTLDAALRVLGEAWHAGAPDEAFLLAPRGMLACMACVRLPDAVQPAAGATSRDAKQLQVRRRATAGLHPPLQADAM